MGFGNKNGAGPEAAAPTGAPPKFVWPPQRQDVKQPTAVAAPAVDNTPPISPTKALLPPITDMEDARVTSAAAVEPVRQSAPTLQDMIDKARANAAATTTLQDRAMDQPHQGHAPDPAEFKLTNPSLPPEPAPAAVRGTRTRRVTPTIPAEAPAVATSATIATVLGGRLAEANQPASAATEAVLATAAVRTATASTDPILAQLHEQLRSAQVHAQNMVARGIEEHDNAVQEAQAIAAARLQNVKTAAAEITASAQAMIDRVAAALSGVPLMDSLAATPARGRPAKASKPEKKASKSTKRPEKKASKKATGPTKGRPVPTGGLGALICSRLAQNWAPEKIAEEGAKKFPDKKCDTRIVSWYKSQIKSGRLVYPK